MAKFREILESELLIGKTTSDVLGPDFLLFYISKCGFCLCGFCLSKQGI